MSNDMRKRMLTVKDVCRISGVSARTLHHYDAIGLLKPVEVTDAGYRLYDGESLKRLSEIMLFKELDFGLSEIKDILDDPNFDKSRVIDEQIKILTIKKERLEKIISASKDIKEKGEYKMDFSVFDKKKSEKYAAEAKKRWGNTEAYKEYKEKTSDYSDEKTKKLSDEMMDIFKVFGEMADKSPDDFPVQNQVKKLKDFITENYYTCTNEILSGLGQMYSAGGEMTENIDSAGGKGTAQFVSRAIKEYCK